MELVNEIQAADAQLASGEVPAAVVREMMRSLILLLAPFAPFLAAELWEELGEEGRSCARRGRRAIRAGERRRDRDSGAGERQAGTVLRVPADSGSKDIEAAALADEKVRLGPRARAS